MTLTIDGTDYSDRLINQGTRNSGQLSDVFGQIAKQKEYALRDYDSFFNPFAPEGLFNLINYRGLEVVETDDAGLVQFRGTIQHVKQADAGVCIISCTEPLVLFLEWPVEASDRDTYTGFRANGAAAKGDSTVTIDGGTTEIPAGSVVWFNDSKVPQYLATTATTSGGATTSITLDRPLEVAVADNESVTVAGPKTTTGPQALKDALTTANPDMLLDGTFDILAASDLAAGYTIIVNVFEQDQVSLRDYIQRICEMTDLQFFQKNDGYYTCIRSMQWDGENITETITGDEICGPVDIDFDDSQLIIGYDLIYKAGENVAAVLSADVDPEMVRKHNGIKYWKPVPSASTFKDLKYLYASEASATYFGNLRLNYYQEPVQVLTCTGKKSFNDDPDNGLDIYVGKQVIITVRGYTAQPARVIAFEYDQQQLQYTNITFQLNGLRKRLGTPAPAVSTYLTSESGDYLITESGDRLIVEAA